MNCDIWHVSEQIRKRIRKADILRCAVMSDIQLSFYIALRDSVN